MASLDELLAKYDSTPAQSGVSSLDDLLNKYTPKQTNPSDYPNFGVKDVNDGSLSTGQWVKKELGATGEQPYGQGAGYLIDNPVTRGLAQGADTAAAGVNELIGRVAVDPIDYFYPGTREAYNKTMIDPAVQQIQAQSIPKTANPLEIGFGNVGNIGAQIAAGFATGGAPNAAGNAALQGLKLASTIGAEQAAADAAQLQAQGKGVNDLQLAGMIAANTAGNLLPTVGKLPARLATGALGGVAGQAMSNVAAGKKTDEGLLAAGVFGTALGSVSGTSPETKINVEKAIEVEPIKTGDVSFDTGQEAASAIQKRTKAPEVQDLFSPQPELSMDMFSKEAVPADLIEQRRRLASAADHNSYARYVDQIPNEFNLFDDIPQRTQSESGNLEQDYLFNQQERINANDPTEAVVSRQGGIPDAYKNIANTEIPSNGSRKIFTRDGQEVGAQERQVNSAMSRAMLEGLAERGKWRNEPTPVEAPKIPEKKYFEPSKNETVGQTAVQQRLDLSTTQDLFSDLGKEHGPAFKTRGSLQEPVKAPTRSEIKSAKTAVVDVIAKANEESMRNTGKPLSVDQMRAIRQQAPKPVLQNLGRASTITESVKSTTSNRIAPPRAIAMALDSGWLKSGDVLDHIIYGPEGQYKDQPQYKAMMSHLHSLGDKLGGLENDINRFNKNDLSHIESFNRIPEKYRKNAVAWWDSIQKKIYALPDATMSDLVHEVSHAITSRALDLGEQGMLKGEPGQYYQHFSGLFDTLEPEIRSKDTSLEQRTTYGMTDLHEFFSELYANPDFREHLKSVKLTPELNSKLGMGRLALAKAKNMYEASIKFLRNIFNLPEKAESALDVLISSGHNFLGSIDESTAKQIREHTSTSEPKAVLQNTPKEESLAGKIRYGIGNTKLGRLTSWRSGQKLAVQKEGSTLVQNSAHALAEHIGKRLDRAGYRGLSDYQKELVDRTMSPKNYEDGPVGKAAYSQLPAKIQEAIDFTRSQIEEYQLRAAAAGIKVDGVDQANMLIQSALDGDYATRTYAVDYIPETLGYKISKLVGNDKPFWREYQQKNDRPAYEAGERYAKQELVIPDSIADDKSALSLAERWGIPEAEKANPDIDIVRAKLQEKKQSLGNTPEAQLDTIMNILSDPRTKDSFGLQVIKQVARDSSILEKRTVYNPDLRKFWGETKDPRLNAGYTIIKLGKLVAQHEALNHIYSDLKGTEIFEPSEVPNGKYRFQIPENDDYGPLAGKYTSEALKKEIETAVGIQKDPAANKVAEEAFHSALDFWGKLGGTLKLSKTVLSGPFGIVRNAISAGGQFTNYMARSAIMGKPFKGIHEAVKALAVNIADIADTKNSIEFRKQMIEAGAMKDSVNLGELHRAVSEIQKELEQEAGKQRFKNATGVKKAVEGLGVGVRSVRKGLRNSLDTVANIYSVSDNWARTFGWLSEYDMQKQLHPNWTPVQLSREATNRVRDQVPTYARAAPGVKFTAKVLANFTTWPSEVVRTTANQYKQAVKDIQDGHVRYGLAQLAGNTAQIAAMTALSTVIARQYTGDDNEKDNEAARSLAPEYNSGDNIYMVEKDNKTGKFLYLDASKIDSSAPISDGLRNVGDNFGPWLARTFFETGPLVQAAKLTGQEYLGGGAEDKYGRKMSHEKYLEAMGQTASPEILNNIQRLQDRLARGSSPKLAYARAMGIPVYEADSHKAIESKLYEFKDANDQIKQRLRSTLSDPKVTPDIVELRYGDYLSDSKQAFAKASEAYQYGKNVFDIKRLARLEMLKKVGLDKDYQEALVANKFKPDDVESLLKLIDESKVKAIANNPQKKEELTKIFNDRKIQLKRLRRQWSTLASLSE